MRKALLAALVLMSLSSGAFARVADDDDAPPPDARTEGFRVEGNNGPPQPLLLPASGTVGTWFVTALLGAVCIGGLFKNGKRSHLD